MHFFNLHKKLNIYIGHDLQSKNPVCKDRIFAYPMSSTILICSVYFFRIYDIIFRLCQNKIKSCFGSVCSICTIFLQPKTELPHFATAPLKFIVCYINSFITALHARRDLLSVFQEELKAR